jgi:hypothetical protein
MRTGSAALMRRVALLTLARAAVILFTVLLFAGSARVVAGDGGARAGGGSADRPLGESNSPCRASVRGMLSETWVSRGDNVIVRTRIGLNCPDRRRPYHVAFVLDAAASRAAGPQSMLAEDLRAFGARLALANNRFVRAAAVAYGAVAHTVCSATGDAERFAACLEVLADPNDEGFAGQGGLADAVREAAKVLLLARGLAVPRASDDPLREGLVVIEGQADCAGACSPQRPECAAARQEARRAADQGMELTVLCLAETCAASCLADVAASAYTVYEWDAMAGAQSDLAWRSELRVARVDMSETLHRSLVVDRASVDYTAGAYDARDHGLIWHLDTRARAGDPVALSYAITATEAGTFPVRLAGGGVLVDTDGLAASFTVPPHELRVSDRPLAHLYVPRALQPPSLEAPRPKPLREP